jgi:hypothetical protein
MRFPFVPVLVLLLLPPGLRAMQIDDLVRIHVEAIGGRQRVEALKSLRATGHVVIGNSQVRFTMLAARPAQVRVETERGGRMRVQGSDGVEAPWEFDTRSSPLQYVTMEPGIARTFQADAEFDDPLVAGAARGFTLDYAGELILEGRKLLRVLVTHRLTGAFSVLLDDETFFIVMRVENRESTGGRRLQVVTHYEDYRPVDGVLLPHTITLAVDGKANQQTKIARMEPNPPLGEGVFSRPKTMAPALAVPPGPGR